MNVVRTVIQNRLEGLPAIGLYRELVRSQYWTREEILAHQAEKLSRLLQYVRARSKAYSRLLEGRDLPMGNASEPRAILERLPIMTKEFVRSTGRELLCRGGAHVLAKQASTGGSTGEPLRVEKSFSSMIYSTALLLRGKYWAGVEPGAPFVNVKGMGSISLRGRMRQWLGGFRSVSAFPAEERNAVELATAVKSVGAAYISGYPSILMTISEYARETGITVPVVFTTGEVLSSGQRVALSSQFGCRVFDYYGSNEVSGIAFECEKGTKHVSDEHVILETVDESGTPVRGTPGRILVTDLDNYAMPFIRYEIGDLGVISDERCSCGRLLTVLRSIEGRTQDKLRNADGKELPVVFFAARFRDLARIRAYQIVQSGEGDIELRYVSLGPGAKAEAQSVGDEIRQRLGLEVLVRQVGIEELETTARGKVRLIIQRD